MTHGSLLPWVRRARRRHIVMGMPQKVQLISKPADAPEFGDVGAA
jgi:hypothetical protein